MAFNTRRRLEIDFAENSTKSAKLDRGVLEMGFILTLRYSANVTTAGTLVRPRGVPVREVRVKTDGGKILHQWRPTTAIRHAEVFEQTGLANIVTPLSGAGVGVQTGRMDIPFFFAQGNALTPEMTAYPTWDYQNTSIEVDWGNITNVLTGAPVAPITVIDSFITMDGLTNLGDVGDGRALAARLGVAVTSYTEVPLLNANAALKIDVPKSADIRAILIETEDATGEAVNTLLNSVTFVENNALRIYSAVNAATLRAANSKVYGMLNGLPAGLHVIDFAEDRDVTDIYAAPQKDTLQLVLDVAAGAGTVRVTTLGIEPPHRRAA